MPPRKRAVPAAAAPSMEDARAQALAAFITAASRKEPGSVFTFTGAPLAVPVVPTGAVSLDVALGVGGLPRSRIVEIYGPESVGKTSLALSVAGEAIRAGGMAAMIDVEHAVTKSHMVSMGADPDYVALSQPTSGEAAFAMLEEMLRQDLFDVIIVDSVAMLTPQVELDGEMTDLQVGAQARMISKGLRKITALVGESKAVVIFINQLRMKIGVMFGNPEDTPGGKALKYCAAVRLDVRAAAGAQIKDPNDSKRKIGLGVTVTVKKNKVAPPTQAAEYQLIWGKGIDKASAVISAAKSLGVLSTTGGNQYVIEATGEMISDPTGKTVRGEANVIDALREQPELTEQLEAACHAALRAARETGAVPAAIPDEDLEPLADEDEEAQAS